MLPQKEKIVSLGFYIIHDFLNSGNALLYFFKDSVKGRLDFSFVGRISYYSESVKDIIFYPVGGRIIIVAVVVPGVIRSISNYNQHGNAGTCSRGISRIK